MSYGQKSHIAIAFQSSFDNSNVTSLYHMQHLDENVGLEIPDLVDESARGVFDEGDSYAGPKVVGGELTINAKAIPMGVLFRGIFGAAAVVTSDAISTHTFKPRTSDFDDWSAGDPLTYFKYLDDGGSATLLYNLNMTTLELGVSNGEFLTAKAGFVGGSIEQIADIAAAFPAGKRMTWDTSSLQLAGSAEGKIKALTIKVDEGLEAMHTLNNSRFPSRVKRTGARTVEVAGTILFDDQVEYQKFLASSEEEMVVSFAGPTEIQSGYTDLLVMTLPAVRHIDFKPVAPGIGQLEVGFTQKAKYSTTSATAMQFALTNLQVIY